ncbi:MAG: tetratricopeptide repeat protein [Candidatus Wallbacteria bacterium]|nr:tetratricopeptide repeat protein [Candidatus Wallbacteria bacterium]
MLKKILTLFLGFLCSLILLEAVLWISGLFTVNSRSVAPSGNDFQIFCCGDSFTFGYGVTQGKDYPSMLQEMLNKDIQLRKFTVSNLGVSGGNTRKVMQRLESQLPASPKIILVQAGMRNYSDFSGYPEKGNPVWQLIRFLSDNARSMKLFRSLLLNLRDKTNDLSWFQIWNFLIESLTTKVEYLHPPLSRPGEGEIPTQPHTSEIVANDDPLKQGLEALDSGRPRTAIKLFREAIRLHPGNTAPLIGLAESFDALSRPDLCREWLESALKLPDNGNSCNALGEFYYDQKKYSAALTILSEGISRHPDHAMLHYNLGRVHSRLNDLANTIRCFDQALSLHLSDPESLADIYVLKGLIKSQSRNAAERQEAEKYFLDAEALTPGSAYLLNSMAEYYQRQENLVKAGEYFRKAGNRQALSWIKRLISLEFDRQKIGDWLRTDYREFISEAQKHGSAILFLNYPEDEIKEMREVAEKFGIPLIDLKTGFDDLWKNGMNRDDFFLPDGHCNAEGNRVMAEIVFETLKKSGLLEQ